MISGSEWRKVAGVQAGEAERWLLDFLRSRSVDAFQILAVLLARGLRMLETLAIILSSETRPGLGLEVVQL